MSTSLEEFQSKDILKNVKKGAHIFIILSVASILILLTFTASKETVESLKRANPLFFCLTTVALICRIYFECIRLQVLTRAFGHSISFKSSADFTLGGYFLSLVPFGIGGLPLQFYILMKEKFSPGEAGAIIGMRGITYLFAFILVIPFLIGYRNLFTSTGMSTLSWYIIVLYGALILLFILAMLKTDSVKDRIERFHMFFIRRNKEKRIKWIDKLCKEIDNFKFGLKQSCVRGSKLLVVTVFLSGVSLFFYAIMVPLLFRTIGVLAPIVKTAMIQLILTFLLMFTPTPGGAGIAEGAGFALYRSICPPELIGVFVILWRFFTYYTGVILGGILILKLLAPASSKR